MLAEGAAESRAARHPLAGQLQRALGGADQAHAVVHATRAQPPLGDFEAATLTQQDILQRHAHVPELDFRVSQRGVVVAQGGQRPHQRHAGRAPGHQHLALLLVAAGVVGVGLAHDNIDLCALVHGVGGKPLATVQHPFVALANDAQFDIGGVTGGHLRFRHDIAGTDLTGEQGGQPLFLLLRRGVFHEYFHIAGVGSIAVEYFRRPQHPPHDFRQRRIVEVAESAMFAELRQAGRNEQVPQAGVARFCF